MNKKVKYIFIGLGLTLIILGLSLLLMTGKNNNKENSNNSSGIEINISQDDMTGDKINNTKYQDFESYTETAETYINSNDMLQKKYLYI